VAELKHAALEEVFRREKARVVGGLVRSLGSVDAAEEAFQDAVVTALSAWTEVPSNPAAWLTTTARHRAIDAARHQRVVAGRASLLNEDAVVEPQTLRSIDDDALRLIFTCCHPALTLESRVALTLKVVLGLSTEEIARAFLSPEKTIAQRIVRAKRTLEEAQIPYEVPEKKELPERFSAVLAVVYLVFNEGHTARHGPLVRVDLQAEALRLAVELTHLSPTEPDVFGLVALIAFSLARADTRTDPEGEIVLLPHQDRARWDGRMIKEGLMALSRARRLRGRGRYVLEAEIAASHVTAPTWEDTDWARILGCYDALLAIEPSPVVALNRAVALGFVAGPQAALDVLEPLARPLDGYHPFHVVRAELLRRMGQCPIDELTRALELATNESERRFLRRELDAAKKDRPT
jgi:RNA polymerase sigma-70 factor (ECF subfamily)